MGLFGYYCLDGKYEYSSYHKKVTLTVKIDTSSNEHLSMIVGAFVRLINIILILRYFCNDSRSTRGCLIFVLINYILIGIGLNVVGPYFDLTRCLIGSFSLVFNIFVIWLVCRYKKLVDK